MAQKHYWLVGTTRRQSQRCGKGRNEYVNVEVDEHEASESDEICSQRLARQDEAQSDGCWNRRSLVLSLAAEEERLQCGDDEQHQHDASFTNTVGKPASFYASTSSWDMPHPREGRHVRFAYALDREIQFLPPISSADTVDHGTTTRDGACWLLFLLLHFLHLLVVFYRIAAGPAVEQERRQELNALFVVMPPMTGFLPTSRTWHQSLFHHETETKDDADDEDDDNDDDEDSFSTDHADFQLLWCHIARKMSSSLRAWNGAW
jgi:hypothetical protein